MASAILISSFTLYSLLKSITSVRKDVKEKVGRRREKKEIRE
jgi:hypothetical protein